MREASLSRSVLVTFIPPLLPRILMDPLTVCFCQPVALAISSSVAPPVLEHRDLRCAFPARALDSTLPVLASTSPRRYPQKLRGIPPFYWRLMRRYVIKSRDGGFEIFTHRAQIGGAGIRVRRRGSEPKARGVRIG